MITMNGLTKRFGQVEALQQISCRIETGSIYGLVGSNGAGKSTLLRILAGVYRPDGGSVEVDGLPPFERPVVKGRTFFVPDFPYFLPHATLDDCVSLYGRFYPNWDQKRFEQLCGMFPLPRKGKIAQFSKGMQRQAALITALATRPDYLLLDEVFDGLDPVMRQLLKRLLSEGVAGGEMTLLIASHNLRELEDLCDHVGLLHRGGILFDRDLDELKLGIHKVQAVFKPVPELTAFEGIEILSATVRGSLLNLVARGTRQQVLDAHDAQNPVFREVLPLTLEEVFISEMEAAGYDIDNILG